jgi:NADH:ubiquinone oxidoreductase subunit E
MLLDSLKLVNNPGSEDQALNSEIRERAMCQLPDAIANLEEGEFTAEQWEAIDGIIDRYRNQPGSLILVLEEIQEAVGYLPKTIQRRVALNLKIPFSEVYSVVTFYSFFTMTPRGRHPIRCCLGTACYVRGGKKILDKLTQILKINPGETTPDRRFSLETVRCLGACGLAPTMVIDEDTFPKVKPLGVKEILESYE